MPIGGVPPTTVSFTCAGSFRWRVRGAAVICHAVAPATGPGHAVMASSEMAARPIAATLDRWITSGRIVAHRAGRAGAGHARQGWVRGRAVAGDEEPDQ